MTLPIVMGLMALAINTAKRAGVIVREVMKTGNLKVVQKTKGEDDPQTEADRSAQRCIIASLSGAYPDIKIIGEEGDSDLNVPSDWLVTDRDESFIKEQCPESLKHVKNEELVIWVDPLDGTSEYTQGFLENVTILIGIAVNSSPVGGVIHQPYYKCANGEYGRTIWGLKGLGAKGFETKSLPLDEFIVTTTRSHSSEKVQKTLEALNPTQVFRVGGAGYKVLQLLEGDAHAYVFASPGCKKWDTCAPEAILEAHGGILTDINGQHYEYHKNVEYVNKNGVLATAKNVPHGEVVEKIQRGIKDL